ncbi:MAG: hypothetical protein ACFFB3_02850 [Candidatus Hodarchaeota archaeon]
MRLSLLVTCFFFYQALIIAPVALDWDSDIAGRNLRSSPATTWQNDLGTDLHQNISQDREGSPFTNAIDEKIVDSENLSEPGQDQSVSINNSKKESLSDFLEEDRFFFDATTYLKEIERDLTQNSSPRSLPSVLSYSIGTTAVLEAYNFSNPGTYYDVTSTLRGTGSRCLIWVDDIEWGTNVTQEDVDHLVNEFDSKIWPLNTQYFGYPSDVNGDGINVSILLLDLDKFGAAGYYSASCESRNNLEMFFIDSEAGNESISLDGTMIHEFQHMIHNNEDLQEERWIDEGCSVFSEYLGEYLLANQDWTFSYFESDPDTSLIYWDYYEDDHPVAINYAMSYLFIYYLSENYGGASAISNLVQNGFYQGIQGIEEAILKPQGKTFDEVFVDWVMANYLDDISFGKRGYKDLDVYTKESGVITLSPGNLSITINDEVDYRAGHAYLLKDFNGTVDISFNGQNNGNFNVSIVEYNRVQNSVQFIPLDTNQDSGTLSSPMYDSIYIFVINQKETVGGFWSDQTVTNSSFSLTVALSSSTVSMDDAIVSIDHADHKFNVTGLKISNQTQTWSEADLVGAEILDIHGNSAELAFSLNYNTQASSWEGRHLNIESLPAGQYICRFFAKNALEGAANDSLPFIIADSLAYWETWIIDNPDDTPGGIEIELFNISYYKTESHFLVKLGLEGPPSLDNSHDYVFYVDLDEDASYDWAAFWSSSSSRSYWLRDVDGWYAKNLHYVLGNNLIFKLPLREYLFIFEMDVKGYTDDNTNSDSTTYQTVNLFGPHSLSTPTIIYPNDSEALVGMEVIQWTAVTDSWTHSVAFAISYSSDGGGSWIELVSDLLTTSYAWNTTTLSDGDSFLIKVVASCTASLTTEDTSDATFSIQNAAHSLSLPTISSPNGNEFFTGIKTIEWAAVTDSFGHSITYTVYYSSNSGSSWTLLVSGLSFTSYEWDTSSAIDGSTYLIKVTAICSHGFSSSDTSDATFTVKNTHLLSSPTITYPNSGEVLSGITTIQWMNASDSLEHAVTYDIYYSNDSGVTWALLVSGLTNASFPWDTRTIENGMNYMLNVTAVCSQNLIETDVTDTAFSIDNEPHTLSTPTISYPNGGETLNGIVTIQWTASTDVWEHTIIYRVYYSDKDGNNWISLATGLTTFSYSWDTTTVLDGTNYLIKVEATCSSGLTALDVSDASFSILNANLDTSKASSSIKEPSTGSPGFTIIACLGLLLLSIATRQRKRRNS